MYEIETETLNKSLIDNPFNIDVVHILPAQPGWYALEVDLRLPDQSGLILEKMTCEKIYAWAVSRDRGIRYPLTASYGLMNILAHLNPAGRVISPTFGDVSLNTWLRLEFGRSEVFNSAPSGELHNLFSSFSNEFMETAPYDVLKFLS